MDGQCEAQHGPVRQPSIRSWEPSGDLARLCGVLTIRRLLTLVLGSLLLIVPSVAGLAQTAIEVDASVGVDGWVDARQPFEVVITVASDVLFDGSIQATMGSIVVVRC